MRVSEIVQADWAQAGVPDDALERLAERVRVDRLAILLGDDQVRLLIVAAPLNSFGVLSRRVLSQLGNGLGVQVDNPGVVGLRVDVTTS